MDKKVIGIGAIILVLGAALGFIVPSFIPPPFSYSNFTIQGGGFSSYNITLPNETSVFFVDANFTVPVNVYVFTGNAFPTWRSMTASQDGFSAAKSLEGKGAVEIFTNVTLFIAPGTGSGTMVYSSNNSTAGYSNPASYSIVFSNANGSTPNSGAVEVHMAYIEPTSLSQLGSGSKVASYLTNVGLMEFVFFIMMPIIGIGVMIYGAFRKRKGVAVAEKSEVDRLYKGIESKHSKRKHPK